MLKPKLIDSAGKRSATGLVLLVCAAALVLMVGGCATMGYSRPESVTVPQIVSMAKSGVPADGIIARIKASGTVYRLKASQLADLENEGVPAKVIDYMQKTYLDAVKRDTRYEDRQYWTMDHDYWYGGSPYGWDDDGGDWDDRGDRDD